MLSVCLTVFFLYPSPSRHISIRNSQPQHFQQHRGERAVCHLRGPRHREALRGFQLRWLQRLLQEECPEEPHVLLQVRTEGTGRVAETKQSLGAEQQSPQSAAAWCFIFFILPASSTTFPDLTPRLWEGSETTLTLGLSSSDHWGKTLGAIAPFFRGHAHALANGYGQPWMRLASKVMPGRRSPITRAEHLAIPCSECSANPTHSLEALQWPPISPPSRGGSVSATYLKCCHCLLHGKRTSKEQQAGQRSVHASEDEAPLLLLQLMLCTLLVVVAPRLSRAISGCDLPAPCPEQPTRRKSQGKPRNPQLTVSKSLGLFE